MHVFGLPDSKKLIRDKQYVSFLKLWHSTNLKKSIESTSHYLSPVTRKQKPLSNFEIFSTKLFVPMRKSTNIQTLHIFFHSIILIHKTVFNSKLFFLKFAGYQNKDNILSSNFCNIEYH